VAWKRVSTREEEISTWKSMSVLFIESEQFGHKQLEKFCIYMNMPVNP